MWQSEVHSNSWSTRCWIWKILFHTLHFGKRKKKKMGNMKSAPRPQLPKKHPVMIMQKQIGADRDTKPVLKHELPQHIADQQQNNQRPRTTQDQPKTKRNDMSDIRIYFSMKRD